MAASKSSSEFGQLIACCAELRLGPTRRQIHVRDRLFELARREVEPLSVDPIVKWSPAGSGVFSNSPPNSS